MQLIIIGMHRSGTSVLARLVNMMGAYFGPESMHTNANLENPAGFWERRDVRALNDFVLHSVDCDWDKISNFDLTALSDQTLLEFEQRAKAIVKDLHPHQPWLLKEPRLCLLFDLWNKVLDAPVCIHIFRNPVEVASSLYTRNKIPLQAGIALWESYNIRALKSTKAQPRILVSHQKLISDPVNEVNSIYEQLCNLGVTGLRLPTEQEITSFIRVELYRERAGADKVAEYLNKNQLTLFHAYKDSKVFNKRRRLAFSAGGAQALANYEHIERELITQIRQQEWRRVEQIKQHEQWLVEQARQYEQWLIEQAKQQEEWSHDHITQQEQKFKEKAQLQQQNLIALNLQKEQQLIEQLNRHWQECQTKIAQKELEMEQHLQLLNAQTKRLAHATDSIFTTRRWRLGNKLANLKSKLLFRQPATARSVTQIKRISDNIKSIQRIKRDLQIDIDLPQHLADIKDALEQQAIEDHEAVTSIADEPQDKPAVERDRSYETAPDLDQFIVTDADHPASEKPVQLPDTKPGKIAIVCWSASHNPMGRAFLLWDTLRRQHDVTMISTEFEYFGKQLWEPIRNFTGFKYKAIKGLSFPLLYSHIQKQIASLEADIVIIVKPKIPSMLIGLLLKRKTNAKVILDIDDNELTFLTKRHEIANIQDLQQTFNQLPVEFSKPWGNVWTSYADTLIPSFNTRLVSNPMLQQEYDGRLIPHLRNERIFNPLLYNAIKIKRELGYQRQDKIILFVGTPHRHKGLAMVADVLHKINNPKYKLLVVGTFAQKEFQQHMMQHPYKHIRFIKNQGFEKLPVYLSVADLICLLQDQQSAVTQFQLPSKISDAMAMMVPIITSPVKPIQSLGIDKLLLTARNSAELEEQIIRTLEKPQTVSKMVLDARAYFLNQLSYQSGLNTLNNIFAGMNQPTEQADQAQQLFLDYVDQACNISGAKGKTDVVFFWKQHDSDIYGRRQDMIVKYLSRHPHIGRILHFDKPVSEDHLAALKADTSETNHNNSIVANIEQRTYRLKDAETEGVFKRIYQYSGEIDLHDYFSYIQSEMQYLSINPNKSIFWFTPTLDHLEEIVGHFNPDHVVSDIIDNDSIWKIKNIKNRYRQCLTNSDVVFVNNQNMQRYCNRLDANIKVHIVENAQEAFTAKQIESWLRPADLPDGKTIGYVGNLDARRLDYKLLAELAASQPDCAIVLIGSDHMSKQQVAEIQQRHNVYVLGVRHYRDAVKYIQHFDVCIMPHLDNKMTRHMNPLKLFLYASLNKPTVSTNVANIQSGLDNLHVAKTDQQFIDKVGQLIHQPQFSDAQTRPSPSIDSLTLPTWDKAVDRMVTIINASKVATKSSPSPLRQSHAD